MPQYWLELLEVEMIARSTKLIINEYLIEIEEGSYSNNNNSSSEEHPAQIISSVLSAIVSKKEESFADTEKQLSKKIIVLMKMMKIRINNFMHLIIIQIKIKLPLQYQEIILLT